MAAKKYNALGACFSGVGADGEFALSDMIPTGWNYENDTLRLLNPANSAISRGYVWLTKEEATEGGVGTAAGWYDYENFTDESATAFDLGSGFLTSLGSASVSFTYSGEVYDQAFTLDCANKKYNIVPNALPRTLKLSELIATGWNYENDTLRKLNPANSAISQGFVWLTKDEATEGGVGTEAGWYDYENFTYEGAQEFSAGEGFMTSLGSTAVKISFPAAMTSAE